MTSQEANWGERDFFVSYEQGDFRWAVWIAWQLEAAGYSVLVQSWDFVPGTNWIKVMQEGVSSSARVLVVLSPSYIASVFGGAEWQAIWAGDPTGASRRVIPVRVAPCDRPGLLSGIVGIDIFDVAESTAKERLHQAIRDAVAGRAKPRIAPAFPGPGPAAVMAPAPPFPGSEPVSEDGRRYEGGREMQVDRTASSPDRLMKVVSKDDGLGVTQGPWENARLDLAPLWVGPKHQLQDFLSRPGLSRQVHQALSPRHDGATPTALIRGDGGTGKTQLAASIWGDETANTAASRVRFALWVTAISQTAIVTAFSDAAIQLGLAAMGDDHERNAGVLLRWLETTTIPWLVVLDDLYEPIHLQGLWPSGPSGRVVVTTRSRDALLRASGRSWIDVDVFTNEEAETYLQMRLAASPLGGGVFDEATELIQDLGRLPLALSRAARVIENDAITCATFRSLLANRARAMLDTLVPDNIHARAVALTWSVATQSADKRVPLGAASPLAVLVSLLNPNGIPEAVIAANACVEFVKSRCETSTSSARDWTWDDVRRALRNLHIFWVVTHDLSNPSYHFLRMHALAQRETWDEARREDPTIREPAIRAASASLLEVWPPVETDALVSEHLRACVAALRDAAEELMWLPMPDEALFRSGRSLDNYGLITQGIAYWADLIKRASAYLPANHAGMLRLKHHLQHFRGQVGKHDSARRELEAIAEGLARAVGADHEFTLHCRHDAAHWQGESGDPRGAMESFDALVDTCADVLGPQHLQTLATRYEAAHWHGRAGNTARAVRELIDLIPEQALALGELHPDTLTSRGDLAHWRGESGDTAGAVADFEALFRDRRRELGARHFHTLGTRHSLARWLGEDGRPARAANELAVLLIDMQKVLGPDHPEVLGARHSGAYWRGEAGDSPGAAKLFEELLVDEERILGQDHPSVLMARVQLAEWRARSGVPGATTSVVGELDRLYRNQLERLGPNHSETLTTRGEMAHWRGVLGDAAGALADLEALTRDREQILGPLHRHTLGTKHSLARWRGESGDAQGAVLALDRLVQDMSRNLQIDHTDILGARRSLAYWRYLSGDRVNGVAEMERLLQDEIRVLGADHRDVLDTDLILREWRRELRDSESDL
jgi:hypothetical protein